MKKAKRKRYLNNKALRKAQLIANPLPQAATPAAAPVLRPRPTAAPGAFQQQARKPCSDLESREPPADDRSSEAELANSEAAPERPLLFPAVPEDHCEVCLHAFCDELPFAPAGSTHRVASAARADLMICSGCAPMVLLLERLQHSSTEIRRFLRVAVAALNTHVSVEAHYPLPMERVVFHYDRPRDLARRSNPYVHRGR
jgi:hypothetical protein